MDFEFEQLEERWKKLTPRERAAILVVAGVREAFPAGHLAKKIKRVKKGEVAEWLPTALTLLRDGGRLISNREIARRVGVSHTMLTKNATFRRVRKMYEE